MVAGWCRQCQTDSFQEGAVQERDTTRRRREAGWRGEGGEREAARGLAGRPPKVRQGTGTGWGMGMRRMNGEGDADDACGGDVVVCGVMMWWRWWCAVVTD